MRIVLHQVPSARGTSRMPFLVPEAALALLQVEKDIGQLVYTDMWRDPISSLLQKRLRPDIPKPGYDPHNYGLSVDLNVGVILESKNIKYEELLHSMKKRNWICHRRDGEKNKPGYEQFNFFKDEPTKYLEKCTLNPETWDSAAELRIWELHGKDFRLTTKEVQARLTRILMYTGKFTETNDAYTREAIMTFQKAWGLNQSGIIDLTLCRTLALVTTELELNQIPAWALKL